MAATNRPRRAAARWHDLSGASASPWTVKNAVSSRPVTAVIAVAGSRPSWCGVIVGSLISSRPVSRRTATVPLGWQRAAVNSTSGFHHAGAGAMRLDRDAA